MHTIPVDKIREEKALLERELACPPAPGAAGSAYHAKIRRFSKLNELCGLFDTMDSCRRQLADNSALLTSEKDPSMLELIREEQGDLQRKLGEAEHAAEMLLMPEDPDSDRDTIVEIRAGTGGEEAALFAADLFRMYTRFCERRGLATDVLSLSPTGRGGFKEVVLSVRGANAFRVFRHESGVHRVQRVPETEANGRIHTSAVTVAVLIEPEDVEIDINPQEIRIDVYRSSGPGGQSVNTTDSAVRITHLPTGIMVQCQDEKSQIKNKAKAMRILKARIKEQREREEEAKVAQDRRQQVGSGDRSEKIRTYNFPQNRVTDHRIGLTVHSLDRVIEGEVDDVIDALIAWRVAQQREAAH